VQDDLLIRFRAAVPKVLHWIKNYAAEHASISRPVSELGFGRLSGAFPLELLERARVAVVSRVPYPPVTEFGLPEITPLEQTRFGGITFRDTFYITAEGQSSERLHFHELVHVVQWSRLGPEKFLLAYGAGLAMFGYRDSPLEQMAYDLEERFESGVLPRDLIENIQVQTDLIWNQVAPILNP
jgi:hypothetical protein